MPTYEYRCTACDNQWEELQKISEPPVEVCPKCAQSTAKRQISGGNFILKGGGWYADLYASSSNKKSNGESKSEGSNGSSGNGKSESSSKSESTSSGSATSSSSASSSTSK